MFDVCIAIISIIVGAILGGIISWRNSIILLDKQEKLRAKRQFREFLNNFIIKISYNDFKKKQKLWKNIQDFFVISDEAVYNLNFCLDKYKKREIEEAYNEFKKPYLSYTYEIDSKKEEDIIKQSITNLKKILELIY